MVSVGKCIGIMTAIGAAGGAATSYVVQSKFDKAVIAQASAQAKDGQIPIGGRTPDGKMWDGKISVDEFKKGLSKKRKIMAAGMAVLSAVSMALISGLTLLLRGKVK